MGMRDKSTFELPFIFNPFFTQRSKMAEEETKEEKPRYPRQYERVPGLDEIDQNDPVALWKAREQFTRDR